MTKCYTVEFGKGDYLGNESRPLYIHDNTTYYIRTSKIRIEHCIEDAKHYKSKSGASSWIRGSLKRVSNHKHNLKSRMESKGVWGWNSNTFKDDAKAEIKNLAKLATILGSAKVVEFECEHPNFNGTTTIRWASWAKEGYARKPEVNVGTNGNHICSVCGVVLKGLPYVRMDKSVCTFCISSIYSSIKTKHDNIPEHLRDQYDTDTFLRGV